MAVTVLHVAPHPDDEAIAAVATLLGLREAGHEVINLAVGLGRRGQEARRLRELEDACDRARFELVVHEPPLGLSRGDDLDDVQRTVAETIVGMAEERDVDVLVAPSPHDGHPTHEAVGRAARDALRALPGRAPVLWLWGLWADLPLPTLYAPFDDERLARARDVLSAHRGEVARNDYEGLLRARGVAGRVLGSERVFGWGEPMKPGPFAEVLTEVVARDGALLACAPRTLDAAAPLGGLTPEAPLDWWLDELSVAARYRSRPR